MHYPHIKIPYLLKSELNELFVTNSIRSFALSMISVFLPIFFLKTGYTIIHILLFYIIGVSAGTFFTYFALKFAARTGAKHSIIMSYPLLILFFACLFNIENFSVNFTILGLSLLFSAGEAFYYMGFHIDFARSSKKSDESRDISIFNALSVVLTIIGPLIGAVIATFFSFKILFLIVIIILAFSFIPLLFSGDIREKINIEFKGILDDERSFIIFFSEGLSDIGRRIFWPTLIFLIGINITEIGGIFTIANLVLALVTLYVGHHSIGNMKSHFLKFGSILHSISLVIRGFLKSLAPIAAATTFGALSLTMMDVPFKRRFYSNSKRRGVYMIYLREFYLHFGRIFSISLALTLYLLYENIIFSFIALIIIGGIATLFMSLIKDE